MKLYYGPGACSLAPHIVARELGLELELVKVDTKTHQTADGRDFFQINPKGYVPALELDNGEILTEGPVVAQYLADSKPNGLAPANGTLERYRLQELLGYINSEIHKSYSPLFNPATSDELKTDRKAYLAKRYGLIEQRLAAGGPFLFGDEFTIADAYLFTVTNWSGRVKLDLSAFPNLLAFQKRVAARPAVQAAMKAEGLIQ
ncbi:MAG TPA: glutathione transferase GstA [Candidatus Saccharimonadia bacterium]|nr:glutathione transferase GstA [Candidatus Saccharimonadia bacterium]